MSSQSQEESLNPSIAALLHLQQRLSSVTCMAALGYAAVNETVFLIPYRQAALWQHPWSGAKPGRGRVVALSGLPVVDPEVPFVQWLSALLAHLTAQHPSLVAVTAGSLPASLAESWQTWLPAYGLWLPLQLPAMEGEESCASRLGGLFLVREQPWSEAEQRLLLHLGLTLAQVWWGLLTRQRWWQRFGGLRPRFPTLVWMTVLGGLMLIPVQQSVLAPAEVVAFKPVVVRAPMEGVVDTFHVTPNQSVVAGQPLLNLDTRKLRNRLEVIGKELEVAQAEHRQALQSVLQDPKGKAKLALLRGRIQQKEADWSYTRNQLERVTLVAPREGVVVFGDEHEWIGRPVSVGERLLMLADPQQVELEVRLPVADAVALQSGTALEFFPAADADRSLAATLRHASYRAELTPEGVLAYTLRGEFTSTERLPRLGLRGTAKIFGERVRLFYHLFRRPLAAARQLFGL
ncbi:MAG: HlyD family secretion protein [Magnetococcus sp. MYC-9]